MPLGSIDETSLTRAVSFSLVQESCLSPRKLQEGEDIKSAAYENSSAYELDEQQSVIKFQIDAAIGSSSLNDIPKSPPPAYQKHITSRLSYLLPRKLSDSVLLSIEQLNNQIRSRFGDLGIAGSVKGQSVSRRRTIDYLPTTSSACRYRTTSPRGSDADNHNRKLTRMESVSSVRYHK
jgi:hypothetical protein